MKILAIFLFILTSCHVTQKAHKSIFITGTVTNDDPGHEPIPGSIVWINGTKVGCETDEKGKYRIDVTSINDTASSYKMSVMYINNVTKDIVFKKKLKKSMIIDIALKPMSIE